MIELTKEQIKDWLARTGRDREWLADQMKVAKGTVDQWFAERGFSDTAIATIKLLMDRDVTQVTGSGDTGLIQFTVEEFERIERARIAAGYKTRPPFYHDAIVRRVDELEAEMNIITLPVRYGDPSATMADKVAEKGEK